MPCIAVVPLNTTRVLFAYHIEQYAQRLFRHDLFVGSAVAVSKVVIAILAFVSLRAGNDTVLNETIPATPLARKHKTYCEKGEDYMITKSIKCVNTLTAVELQSVR